jgi:hypothetical protein
VPNPDRDETIRAAAGERIVAFARPGKAPEIPFVGGSDLRPPFEDPTNSREASTVSKASWRKVAASGAMGMMAVTKKREVRKSLRQPAWITLEGGFAARQCMVQDISSSGAKITVDDPDILPAKLRLAFSRDARTGRNCAVVWRRGKSAGVKFVR